LAVLDRLGRAIAARCHTTDVLSSEALKTGKATFMTSADETWQPARLFPITGIGGADEQERRGCSAFLAVLQSVREFGRALTMRCGAPAGTIETYIEVPFTLGEAKFRPDGLIRVSRGQKTWTALLEVKTGRNDLGTEQVSHYLDIAKEQGFDAVITISHEVATTPGVHPVAVDKRKLRKVDLFHLSWSRIHTEALLEQTNQMVSDLDQAWILAEFVRYLENPKSGAWDFDDMGADWVAVRNAAGLQTLRASDKETLNVVARFDQLLAFSGMELSRRLGASVQQRLSRKERAEPATRVQEQAIQLAKTGQLLGSLVIPNAAAPIDILVDLRANRVDCSAVLQAPTEGRASTRVNWLLRQLKVAPRDLMITASSARARDNGPSHPLHALVENPMLLVENPQADIRSFTVTLCRPAGTKRGQGKGSFVSSVTDLVDRFYAEVLLSLKPWSAPPPRPKSPPKEDAQEVVPPTTIEPDGVTDIIEDDQADADQTTSPNWLPLSSEDLDPPATE
jgi:hypothetical protein